MMIQGAPVVLGGKKKSNVPAFAYTGKYNVRDDDVVELLESGEITFVEDGVIDVFMVGGGGHGGYTKGWKLSVGCGGGGGGYTRTLRKIAVAANTSLSVTVGAGDTNVSTSGGQGGSSAFNNYTVQGGYSCELNAREDRGRRAIKGANGGSGGAAGVASTSDGGADGSNGEAGENSPNTSDKGGTGQNFTTREFGEPTGKLYGGGGGGGRVTASITPVISIGGSGGGGAGGFQHINNQTPQQAPAAGGANTGGGGGGSAINGNGNSVGYGASGGSGIVCFREAQKLPELAGTWVLNNRVYPVNNFNQSIGCTVFINNTVTQHDITTIVDNGTTLRFFKGGSIEYSCTYSSQQWNVNAQVTSIRFYDGATASDEFRAWLASNASKQS